MISPILGNKCRYLPTCSEYYIESLKIGDDVVTDSGIYGRVVSIKDETVTLVLKKGEIEILKSKILHT